MLIRFVTAIAGLTTTGARFMETDQFRLKAPSVDAFWPNTLRAYVPAPMGVVTRFAVVPFSARNVVGMGLIRFGGGVGLGASTLMVAVNPVGPETTEVVTVTLVI